VRQWADGTRVVSGGADLQRLRVAYGAARLLAERDSPSVVQAWFQGSRCRRLPPATAPDGKMWR
jgi:hypothetical protein